ncbi:hypothetical protein SAMN05421880_11361 [Nitrosomonas nitrosa]|uniref:Uncharacterized protein n=1 Tax=Nitrosomonas nitrosa TaxID=52442 RepID=A0A1I4Q1I2_9PROT|nr:hypothetical protein SAMN05421880_11361 [Nitrosomonas nitrosa]
MNDVPVSIMLKRFTHFHNVMFSHPRILFFISITPVQTKLTFYAEVLVKNKDK